MTVTDCVEMGIEAAAERALEVAWDGAEAVWLSFDVDCLDAAFVPGTGWPEPGGFLPREVLKFIQLIAERPLAGIEVVECSPPYDNAEITALIATRVICDTLGCLVRAGHLPKNRSADGDHRGSNASDSVDGHADAEDLAGFGYAQQLHRTPRPLRVLRRRLLVRVHPDHRLPSSSRFGFSFGGTAFFWTWPMVFVGQLLVALVFAELAAPLPDRRLRLPVVAAMAGGDRSAGSPAG